MKNLTKTLGVITMGVVITLVWGLGLAGCATQVPIKSVRPATISGMDTVKNMGIQEFQNKSGVGGPLGAQLTQYLTDKVKSMIPATGKFTMVASNDPNADGVFFGELRSVASQDTRQDGSYKTKDGDIVNFTDYKRTVSVSFVYGVRSSRTNMELGQISKQGSTSSNSRDDPSRLTDPLALAKSIVDAQMRGFEKDIVPTIVSTNRTLMKETSKDKAVKQLMKTAEALVKNGNIQEAINQYDKIASEHGSVAAKTNAGILREAIASDIAAKSEMAQRDSERTGLVQGAVKNAVDSLNSKLPANARIMIMKQNANDRDALDDIVTQITTAIVGAKKFTVIGRENQALIDAEQKHQLSGDVSDETAVSIGKQIGVKYAVLCWISGTMSSRKLNLRVLDIETAKITEQNSFDI